MADATVRPPDAVPDADGMPRYRIVGVDLPVTYTDVVELGFDLDGDGISDNRLGTGHALLHQLSPAFDVGGVLERRLELLEWTFTIGHGVAWIDRIPLGALGDALGSADPGWIEVIPHARVDVADGDHAVVALGVAIPTADVHAHVVPALAAYFTSRLAIGDSDFAADADSDEDGVITVAELLATTLVSTMLTPDLEPDHLSLGFRVLAVR
jgi:hypothetical protein